MVQVQSELGLGSDPLWFKDAVIYQISVRAFADSNGDGVGDFRGLTSRLGYLEDLGVTAVWLLPFYPSPLRDDGYDIADYTGIHPAYGTMRDFDRFVREAHRRGIRVITELVINHTSDQHPWFQRARRAAKGSMERSFYVWNDTQQKYAGTRIIFKDFEPSNWSLDPVAGQYYWHRFYHHQPDLNFDSRHVRRALFRVLDFWLKKGVDGLRLDAVPYLYEREGTSCENLPETHAFLRELRAHIDRRFENRMLLAEANQWPEDAVAYFGEGDECHMAFHFPVMPRLFMAMKLEDRFPILDIMRQTPGIPANAQWAMFLRNHDELTLEMVTDRERDYMYQAYARDREMRINLGIRRRLAPLLGNERKAIELMNCLLFSLPGTPIIYYGDEIGMGDNVYLGDRNGVRTPMQWSPDRNAGFSRANPQRLYLPPVIDPEYHYEAVNVENQQNNPRSLLWWMKRLMRIRKRFQAFGRGSLRFVEGANPRVLAFERELEGQRLLVAANLSRFSQSTDLPLTELQGLRPVELFGNTPFPPIEEGRYRLTLGPYAFYWFALERERIELDDPGGRPPAAVIRVDRQWEAVFKGRSLRRLEDVMPDFLLRQRWYGGRGKTVDMVRMLDSVRLTVGEGAVHLVLLMVEFNDHMVHYYLVPMGFAEGERAERLCQQWPTEIIAELRVGSRRRGALYDAARDADFGRALLELMVRRRRAEGKSGVLAGAPAHMPRGILRDARAEEPEFAQRARSYSAIKLAGKVKVKLFRHLAPGVNTDLELGRLLTVDLGFEHAQKLAGHLEYRRDGGEPLTVAVAHQVVEHQGTAWEYAARMLHRYFEQAATKSREGVRPPRLAGHPLQRAAQEPPAVARELMAFFLEQMAVLGKRTAQMHLALAQARAAEYAPEPFAGFFQRGAYQGMRNQVIEAWQALRGRLDSMPEEQQARTRELLLQEGDVLERLAPIRARRLSGTRIRIHGGYHLDLLLHTGKDFVITDFEGEPGRSLSERRAKTSALRDVAGLLRSISYVSHVALARAVEQGTTAPEGELEAWRQAWCHWTAQACLRGYLEESAGSGLLPEDEEEIRTLLDVFTLEKAVYELSYEAENRPQWLRIPVEDILAMLAASADSE